EREGEETDGEYNDDAARQTHSDLLLFFWCLRVYGVGSRSTLCREKDGRATISSVRASTRRSGRPTVLTRELRRARRRHALFRGLLERIAEREQFRLAARHSRKAHAEWSRLRVEALGELRRGRRWRVRHEAEGHGHRRIAGTRGDVRAKAGGKEQRVEI